MRIESSSLLLNVNNDVIGSEELLKSHIVEAWIEINQPFSKSGSQSTYAYKVSASKYDFRSYLNALKSEIEIRDY